MRNILFTLMISFGALSADAQLSFTRSDFTQAPAKYRYHVDENFVLPNVDATGSGLVWDFTKAQQMGENVTIFHIASTTPDFSDFPNSDIAFQKDSTDDIMYYMVDGVDSVVVVGSNDPNLPDIHFRPLVFPLELNTAWNDKGSRFVKAKGSDYGYPQADSVKVTINYQFINKAEGEGKLKLASGQIDALKLRTINKVTFDAQAKIGFWIPLPGLIDDVIDTSYSFYAKNQGYAIISMESNKDGSFYVNYQELPKNTSSVNKVYSSENRLVYPNPATNFLSLTFKEADHFEITDMVGKTIKSGGIDNASIDISPLNQGNYIIRVYTNGEMTGIQKFVKQ